MAKETVEIVYAANEAYLPMVGVSVFSLIRHAAPDRLYRVTILVEDVPHESQIGLLALRRPNVIVRFVDVRRWMEAYAITTVRYYSREVAYRLIVDRVFSKSGKVLYIDADTLVCRDVAELFDTDIARQGKTVGAVHDLGLVPSFAEHVRDELQFPLEEYFNSGVLLIDVAKFREHRIGERAMELLVEHQYPYPDQDALNIVLRGNVALLDRRWNALWGGIIAFPPEEIAHEKMQEALSLLQSAYILHYSSEWKPWGHPELPFAELWWEAARTSGVAAAVASCVRENLVKDAPPFERYVFPWNLVEPNERIYLYGGGVVGASFAWQLALTRYAEVITVIDQHPEQVHGVFNRVCSFDDWKSSGVYQGERIVIAIERPETVAAIRHDLCVVGIPERRILWAPPGRKKIGSLP